MAEPSAGFADLLRELRTGAGLTQEELAGAAGLSVRSVAYLERGAVARPQEMTVRLLADALGLVGQARAEFEAAARGRTVAGGVTATRALPRDVASFTGRERELELLTRAAARAGGVVGIHAIGGMAGVGKTALAVHVAHRLADRFPGGQVFLPLHGHTPGQKPVDPEDALASLLLTAGVAPAQVPPGLAARAALWRDRLAGRRLLLILDDAVDSGQVEPLLPGAGGSLVLVTSRRRLSALDGATMVSLEALPPEQAATLLVRLAGRPGLGAGDPGVAKMTRLCGYLPLAIGMTARQLHHHPTWSVAGRATELSAARDRLDLMTTENLSVAAAFDLSYADLAPYLQRLFRRLGLHPGAEFDAYAASALDGTSPAVARRGLEGLYDQYLLTEPGPGRYRMHDLIREHARALAGRDDQDADRDAATERLLAYYTRTATLADSLIHRQARPAASAVDGAGPAVPGLNDREDALAWARAERASLTACLDHATAAGRDAHVIGLTAGLAGLLRHDGPWTEAISRHETAIRAAERLGDRRGQANALHDLGDALRLTDDYPAAARVIEQALDIHRDIGDRLGQANALHDLGAMHWWTTADFPAAARVLEQALDIYRDIGDRLGQANALSELGMIWTMGGHRPAAAPLLEQALHIHRELGDRMGEATTLRRVGALLRSSSDFPAAVQVLEQALHIHRDLRDRMGEANALLDLGMVWRRTGDHPAAIRDLEQALGIYRDIGNRRGQANALRELGTAYGQSGDFPAAIRDLEQALGIYRDVGNPTGEATVLNLKGALHQISGDLVRAEARHQEALQLARAIASDGNEAHALAGLNRCALAADNAAQGEVLMQEALEILSELAECGVDVREPT